LRDGKGERVSSVGNFDPVDTTILEVDIGRGVLVAVGIGLNGV
jgi:hypothetical protein